MPTYFHNRFPNNRYLCRFHKLHSRFIIFRLSMPLSFRAWRGIYLNQPSAIGGLLNYSFFIIHYSLLLSFLRKQDSIFPFSISPAASPRGFLMFHRILRILFHPIPTNRDNIQHSKFRYSIFSSFSNLKYEIRNPLYLVHLVHSVHIVRASPCSSIPSIPINFINCSESVLQAIT